MYTKRLLKFVAAHSGLFTTKEIASVWKRSEYDVWNSAQLLHKRKKIKVKQGVLYAI